MTTHKKVKFPFEVTKGKAQDLYRLKFIRRSELEPGSRHFMRHAVGQLDRQLDVWCKQHAFTLGGLSRAQGKLLQSGRQLRLERRRIQRQEYARYQEQVRDRLQQIRQRLLLMRVVNRFKENAEQCRKDREREIAEQIRSYKEQKNAEQNRSHREQEFVEQIRNFSDWEIADQSQEMGKRPRVDFLRVPGNEEYMFGYSGSKDKTNVHAQRKPEEHHQKKHKMPTSATALSNFPQTSSKQTVSEADDRTQVGSSHHAFPQVGNSSEGNRPASDTDDTDTSDDHHGHQSGGGGVAMAIFGQPFLQSSTRMETIPEENTEEVEVEMDDMSGEMCLPIAS